MRMSCHFLGTDFTGEKGQAAKGLCREREKTYAMVRRLMPQIRDASLSQKAATLQEGEPCVTSTLHESNFITYGFSKRRPPWYKQRTSAPNLLVIASVSNERHIFQSSPN